MSKEKNGNAFFTPGIIIHPMCKFFVAVLFFSLAPIVSSLASITIDFSMDAKNIVYDPETRIAQTSSRTTLTINGLSVYADKTQVDFKENILRASGRVVVGTLYTGDEMVVNIKYGDAALYISKKLETPIYFSINENIGRPVPVIKQIKGLIPEFARQPGTNVIHCQYISYYEPGKFTMNHVYYIDPEGNRRYSSKLITDSPDLMFTKTVSDVVVNSTKRVKGSYSSSSEYKAPKKWYMEDGSSVIWLTDTFKSSSWVYLSGKIDPSTGRSFISPELNYNATVKNSNLNIFTEQSQETNYAGLSITKYNDLRKLKSIAVSSERNEYYDRFYYYAYFPKDVSDEKEIRASYQQTQNNQNLQLTFIASDSSRFSSGDEDRSTNNYEYKEHYINNDSDRLKYYNASYSLRPVMFSHAPFLISLVGYGKLYDEKSSYYYQNYYYRTAPGFKDFRYRMQNETYDSTFWNLSLRGYLNTNTIAIGRKSFFKMYAQYEAYYSGYRSNYYSEYYYESSSINERDYFSRIQSNYNSFYLYVNSMIHKQLGRRSAIGVAVSNSHSSSSYADIYPFISYSSGNGNYYRLEYDYDVKTSRWEPATLSARILSYGSYRYSGTAKYNFKTNRFSSGAHTLDKETKLGVFSISYEEPSSTFMIRYQSGESYGANRGGALDDYQQRSEI